MSFRAVPVGSANSASHGRFTVDGSGCRECRTENGVHVLSLGIAYPVFVGMRAFREEGGQWWLWESSVSILASGRIDMPKF